MANETHMGSMSSDDVTREHLSKGKRKVVKMACGTAKPKGKKPKK
jgi:hypothetical protein